MTPSQRYAEGLRRWRGERTARSNAFLKSLRSNRGADRFADPRGGMTYFERRQVDTRRPFGARPR